MNAIIHSIILFILYYVTPLNLYSYINTHCFIVIFTTHTEKLFFSSFILLIKFHVKLPNPTHRHSVRTRDIRKPLHTNIMPENQPHKNTADLAPPLHHIHILQLPIFPPGSEFWWGNSYNIFSLHLHDQNDGLNQTNLFTWQNNWYNKTNK